MFRSHSRIHTTLARTEDNVVTKMLTLTMAKRSMFFCTNQCFFLFYGYVMLVTMSRLALIREMTKTVEKASEELTLLVSLCGGWLV